MNEEEALNYFFLIWVMGTLIIYLLTYTFGLVAGAILAIPTLLFFISLIIPRE